MVEWCRALDPMYIGPMVYPGSSSLYLIIIIIAFYLQYIFFYLPFFSPKVNPLKRPVIWGHCLIKMCLKLAGQRVFWNAGIADSLAELQNNPVSSQQISTVRFPSPSPTIITKALMILSIGLPQWLRSKDPTCQCRRQGFHPWVRKVPWRREWQELLPGKSQEQKSLEGYSLWGHKRVGHNWATKQHHRPNC